MYILELLTAQQYAEMAGISLPGAYKRLNGILKDRVHKVNGKIFIDVSGLDLNPLKESIEENTLQENQDKSSNIAGLQDIIKVKEELIQNLKQQIETLQNQYQAQLSTKDETIAALQAQIHQMEHQIDNLTQLLSQAQQLAMSQQLAIIQHKPSFWSRFCRFFRK